MLKIQIPNNFLHERKYLLDIIFVDFLGIDYLSESKNELNEYIITIDNDRKLIIKDYFFSKNSETEGYLKEENIPQNIFFSKNQFNSEPDLPVIFGKDEINIAGNDIISHLDIFSSAFFMLTRWEEFVIKKRDKHNRFPEELSLAQKFGFHYRPVVNEYIENLWNMISFLGTKQKRKRFSYTPKITHDIDFIARYDTLSKYFKAVLGDIFRQKSLILPFKTTRHYLNIKKNKQKDSFDTFDYLMQQSEKKGLKSHFYFIPGLIGEKNVKYNITDDKVEKLIRDIIKRGHKIGLHASYESYNNTNLFKEEKKRLLKIYPQITEGRQHFMRFENPVTWQIWYESEMLIDSTMGFTNDVGFRCGTCFEFNVFNILSRKKLELKEQPLIVMDSALRKKYESHEKVLNVVTDLIKTTKKYSGQFVMLWHNSSFNVKEWDGFDKVYEEIINIL